MQVVVIYGNSLVVSSIGASLQECAGVTIVPVDPAMSDAGGNLSALQPDAVIFDLATAQPDFAIALWKKQPQLLLIGVDLPKGQALVLSSQSTRVLTTDDLLQVIAGQSGEDKGPPDKQGQTRFPNDSHI